MLVIVPQASVQGEPAVVLSPKTTGAAAKRIASILEDRGLPSQSPSILDRSEQSDSFCSYSDRQKERGGSKGRAPKVSDHVRMRNGNGNLGLETAQGGKASFFH